MSDILNRISNMILKLVTDLENDIGSNTISLKDKKHFTDLVNKLLPMILKLQKINSLENNNKLCENDLKIISDFLEKNMIHAEKDVGSERGI